MMIIFGPPGRSLRSAQAGRTEGLPISSMGSKDSGSSNESGGMAVFWVVFMILLMTSACGQKPGVAPPSPPKVTVSEPVVRDVTDHLEITGNTQAVNTVQLRARVEGYLDRVLFKDGAEVKKGQLLFLIQQDTYKARLQQAEGNVLTQKALLEHAKIEFNRYANLVGQKAVSQTEVENWRYQRDSAEAALLTAEAQRDLARLDLGYTWVTAPFNGVVNRRLVDAGNVVGTAQNTVLAEVTQIDPLYLYFNLSEGDLPRLLNSFGKIWGQEDPPRYPIFFGLAEEDGYPHQGRLDFAAPIVSTSTGTVLLRGIVSNKDRRILPGQFARVMIPVGQPKPALLVPQVAVANDQLGAFVLVVGVGKIVQRRNVRTGPAQDGMIAVLEGLSGGEQVIVSGFLKAVPGKPVTPETQAAAQQGPSLNGPPPLPAQGAAQ